MVCGIVLLLLLPNFLSPGLIEKQRNSKQFIDSIAPHRLKQRRCRDHRLKDSEIALMIITILNVAVLISLCAMVNELLLRIPRLTQPVQVAQQPPPYEEVAGRS